MVAPKAFTFFGGVTSLNVSGSLSLSFTFSVVDSCASSSTSKLLSPAVGGEFFSAARAGAATATTATATTAAAHRKGD